MIDYENELKPATPSALLLEIYFVTEVVQTEWFGSYLEALDHCQQKYKMPDGGWCICEESLVEQPSGYRIKLKYLVDETLTLWLVIPVFLKPGQYFPLPCGFCE